MECVEEESLLMLLPNEIKSAILGFLRPRDILACSRVCREWHALCNDPYLWKVYVDRKAERPWRQETLNVEKSDEEEAKMELIEVQMLKIQAAREHFELTLNQRIEERDKKLFRIKKKESNSAQKLALNIQTKDKIKYLGTIASIIMVVFLFWNYFSIYGIPTGIILGAGTLIPLHIFANPSFSLRAISSKDNRSSFSTHDSVLESALLFIMQKTVGVHPCFFITNRLTK